MSKPTVATSEINNRFCMSKSRDCNTDQLFGLPSVALVHVIYSVFNNLYYYHLIPTVMAAIYYLI